MKNITRLLLLLWISTGSAQELTIPIATQYLADNPFVMSATFAGIGDNFRLRINGMKQWVSVKEAPANQSIYADFRIADQSGIGLSLYNDTNGYTSQSGGKISFAHHIILDYYSRQYLSFGMSFNVNNFKIDISQLVPNTYDPTIINNRSTVNNNFDVGFLYRNKEFYMSINAANILNKNTDQFSGTNLEPRFLRNYQAYMGYIIKTNNYAELEPSVFYQYYQSDKRSSTDLNLKYRKFNNNNDYNWAGITYRYLNDQIAKPLTIGPMAGFKKSGFYFGYSYQVTLNQLVRYNAGTHVLTLGYDFLSNMSNCPCTQSPVHD